MSTQRGRNGGVTGLVDIQGTPAFRLKATKFSQQEGAQPLVRTGRGDARRRIKQTAPGGTLLLWGEVRGDGFPEPSTLKGCAGSVTLTYSGARKTVLQVVVLEATISYSHREEDVWQVALVCEVTANPDFQGFDGTQTVVDPTPTLNHVELHQGNTKRLDPDEIGDTDTYVLDVEGLDDTSDAEINWVRDRIAEYLATRVGMKVRLADFARADHWGGTLTVTIARTTTGEDLVNQNSYTVDDINHIAATAVVAGIDEPGDSPSGLIYRTTRTQEINDLHTLVLDEYGLRTTAQDVTMPESGTTLDPLGIESEQRETLTYASAGAAPPAPDPASAELQVVSTSTQDVNMLTRKVTYGYGVLNSEQRVGFAKVDTTDDGENIRDTAVRYKFFPHGGAAPAAPDDPPANNVKLIHRQDLRVTPVKDVRVFVYGPRSSRDDAVLGETQTVDDPQGLTGSAALAYLDGETPPAAPAGLVYRTTRRVPLTDGLAIDRTLLVDVYGTRSTKDDVEMDGAFRFDDESFVESQEVVVTVTNAASLTPAATLGSLVLRDRRRKTLNGSLYAHYLTYGVQTRDQELVARASRTTAPAARGRVDADAVLASGTNPVSVALGGTNLAVIDPTASIESAAEAVRAALLGDATFEGADVERVHPSKLLLTLHRRGTRWWMDLESRTFTGLLAPWRLLGGGVVQVFVADVVQLRSGLWEYVIGEVPAACTIMDFTIWKTYTGDTLYTNANAAGLTNADPFLGFSALTVTYAGVTGPVAIRDTYRYGSTSGPFAEGARTQGWRFRFDSRGIVAADGICPGYRRYTTADLSGVSPGSWVNASVLGVSAASATPFDFDQAFLNTTP